MRAQFSQSGILEQRQEIARAFDGMLSRFLGKIALKSRHVAWLQAIENNAEKRRMKKFRRPGYILWHRGSFRCRMRWPMTQKLLERKPAAAYVQSTWGIPCSPKWLAKLACVGTDGPPFYKAGRTPLYDTADLDAWAKKRLGAKRRSTSELAVTDSQKISVHDVRSVAKGGRNEA